MNKTFDDYPGFRGLNPTQIENFVAACEDRAHEAGSTLIQQGGTEGQVYFLYEGKVNIVVAASEGERELATVEAPAILGEMEFLTGSPRSATVRVVDSARALQIKAPELRARLSDGDPAALKIIYNVATVLAKRLAEMDHKLSEIEIEEPSRTADLAAFHRKLYEDWSV